SSRRTCGLQRSDAALWPDQLARAVGMVHDSRAGNPSTQECFHCHVDGGRGWGRPALEFEQCLAQRMEGGSPRRARSGSCDRNADPRLRFADPCLAMAGQRLKAVLLRVGSQWLNWWARRLKRTPRPEEDARQQAWEPGESAEAPSAGGVEETAY